MKKNKSDWAFESRIGAIAFVFCAVYFYFGTKLAVDNHTLTVNMNSIGPDVFPKAIGVVGMFVSLCIFIPALINYLKAEPAKEGEPKSVRKPIFTKDRVIILAALVIYLLVVEYIVYILATV